MLFYGNAYKHSFPNTKSKLSVISFTKKEDIIFYSTGRLNGLLKPDIIINSLINNLYIKVKTNKIN